MRIRTGFEEISSAEISELEEFLEREPLAKRSMSIPMLDGFLTAIVIGPEMVMPSDYLPWIWDWKRGKKDVEFADHDEANRIFGCVTKMQNRVAGPLMGAAPVVVPVFVFEPAWDHREWLTGFVMGADFDAEVWDHAREDAPELFEPLKVISGMEPDARDWDLSLIHISEPTRPY